MDRTDSKIDTPLTRGSSRPVRYELIDKDGRSVKQSDDPVLLANRAKNMWPDQEQDEDRTGKGWDIQVVVSDKVHAAGGDGTFDERDD